MRLPSFIKLFDNPKGAIIKEYEWTTQERLGDFLLNGRFPSRFFVKAAFSSLT